MPLRESSSWTARYEDDVEINPLRRYYLIFEGAHTELKYFEGIDNNRKDLGINSGIELVILNKDDEIENYSHPKKLFELINDKKGQLKKDGNYDAQIDQFVIIFDRDSYKTPEEFIEFVDLASKDNMLGFTNPCFELWLILHYDNSLEEYIVKYYKEILENKKVSKNHTFTSKLFSQLSGMSPKSNLNFEKLMPGIEFAISQEKELPQDRDGVAIKIGSNIGMLIQQMRQDPRHEILSL